MRNPLRFYSLQTKIQARRNEELIKMPIIESIRKLKMDGYTPTEIARSLDIDRGTVYKYQDTKNYECQSDVRYWYEDTLHGEPRKSSTLKADIYFDPVRKALKTRELDAAIKEQRFLLSDLKEQGTEVPVLQDLKDDCPLYDIVLDQGSHVDSFAFSLKRVESRKRTMGYIVLLQNDLGYDAAEAWETYRLRDEQEKYFSV
ncbi:MAG: hypothetical protein LKE40_07945 [Spirochaetia bacterium]|jgi:hypothetical protein|nr:hypothetical protein [Spirochaetia bacterium]